MRSHTRILVAIDPSCWVAAAIDWAVQFAERSSAKIELLYVWDEPGPILLAEHGDALLSSTSSSQVPIRTRVVVGDFAPTIVQIANAEHVHLIVMGVNEANRLSDTKDESLAHRVALGSECPVVMVTGAMIDDWGRIA
jgi:nucleotide-binding universal stress UspA family protein